jgi:1-pyrroline-5-carboxylate dehydrogenase
MAFRLTYSTMFNPPEELHARFDAALAGVRAGLGATHAHFIGGRDQAASRTRPQHSPIDTRVLLGQFPDGTAADAGAALHAAHEAFPRWRAMPAGARITLLRRAGDLIEERVYGIAAAVSLEVGKNRMEALGEVQETADFFRVYCDDFERHSGFDRALPDDPLPDFRSHNRSVMKPHGVWVVITPFNYPFALAGGPVAAALVTGNTVVLKGATDTPWAGRLLADCLRDAGLPPGVFNYVGGSGSVVGAALVRDARVAGVTFTGSYAVGMDLVKRFATGAWPRPCIAEMGGKNAVIVTRRADLERAALGIQRSAFGMGGQKCSALSRIYVDDAVAAPLIERLKTHTATITIGDPTRREHWLGPLISQSAMSNYVRYAAQLRDGGATIHAGGERIADGELAHGFYCRPTLAEAPLNHPLWSEELFVPIVLLARVPDRDTAMRLANDSPLGLTAGFYGGADEVAWFHEHIEAGVTYANRPQGATTGAWPGYQPFGGWKGSGSTGKAIASFYYLAQYLREQSQTVVELHG